MKRQLKFSEAKELLSRYGIIISGAVVKTKEEAVRESDSAGYPVVLKAVSEKIIHKTDVGVVRLDLINAAQVRTAYDKIVKNAEAAAGPEALEGILVQRMAHGYAEVLVGAKRDACYGPVVMVGLGGKFVELWEDASPGVGLLDRKDVERMLSHTKADIIMKGFRGPKLDRDAVIELTIKISQLMDKNPDILELDLNPVIVYEKGIDLVDARVIRGKPMLSPRAHDIVASRLEQIDYVFNPKSVAVIGASKAGTTGGTILQNMRSFKKLYPVNPKLQSIMGLKCYPGLDSLPEPPELGVFVIGAERVPAMFEKFFGMGGKGAVVVSDGFREIGRSDLEEQLVATARKYDVIYVGPNCLGVIDNFTGVNTMFVPARRSNIGKKPSGIGVITQSGGIGIELLEMLAGDNLSVGKWVSCGNSSGVSIPELLKYMSESDQIQIIILYIEGLSNGLQFVEIGKQASVKKPVVVIKGGVSGGAAATMSHTASLAGSYQAFKAACEGAGFFLIEELTEDPKIAVNVLSMLSTQPMAKGKRIAVATVGGGAGILLADQVTNSGLELAVFSEKTKLRLAELLQDKIRSSKVEERDRIAEKISANPLDIFADCSDDKLIETLRTLNEDDGVDAILAAIYFQVPTLSEYITDRLVELSAEMTKPLLLSPRGYSEHGWRLRTYMAERNVSSYTVPLVKSLAIAIDIWSKYNRSFRTIGNV